MSAWVNLYRNLQECIEKSTQRSLKSQLNSRSRRGFQKITTDTAKRHVGKTKPGRGRISWVTPAVGDGIKKRNKLRKNVSNKRKDWIDACQGTRMGNQLCVACLKTPLIQVIIGNCGVIKTLNSTPEDKSRNEAMIRNNRCIMWDKR